MTWTLHEGDCMDILPTLATGSIDAVVTDPPYGIQMDKANAHSSIRDNPNWDVAGWDLQRPSRKTFIAILKCASLVAIWGGNYFADFLPASSGWLCWRKPEAETGFSLADCELCWTNRPMGIRMRTITRRDGSLHPTQKPVEVMKWTMDILRIPIGATVLDPFAGSGTTGVACIRTGRNFIGIELDPNYCRIARKRLEDAAAQQPLFSIDAINETTHKQLALED